MPIVLTIAGSDPSGGAGIQADLRTINSLGAVGLSAITALTVQNSHGVAGVEPVSAALLTSQLNALLDDATPHAVKIGMLCNKDQIDAVAAALNRIPGVPVVLDPVLAPTIGDAFMQDDARDHLLTRLSRYATIITPNLPEAALLWGRPIGARIEEAQAAQSLLSHGAGAVLITGGHRLDAAIDRLYFIDRETLSYEAPRLETKHTHGTGCLLSTATAVGLARGLSIQESVASAKELTTKALNHPVVIGTGRGYPDASPVRPRAGTHEALLEKIKGVYVVTDPRLSRGRSYDQIALATSMSGVTVLQLRDKDASTPALLAAARALRRITREHGMALILNDRIDVALAVDADGVHLGPEDIDPATARELLGPDRLIGVSTGTVEEALAARHHASYFGVGPIFGTATKHDAGDAVGPERILAIREAVPEIPVVAIGGIQADNIGKTSAAGAVAAAVVSSAVGAEDITEACRLLALRFAN